MANDTRMATKEEKASVDQKLTHPAFGTAEINGTWHVIELAYNPTTKAATVVKSYLCVGRDDSRVTFKVKVGESNIL